MGHQQQVPGAEEVGDALHHIGDLAPQQEDDLVELMVMVADLLGPAVLQPDEAEVLPQIAPLARVLCSRHGGTPFPKSYPHFSIPIASFQ